MKSTMTINHSGFLSEKLEIEKAKSLFMVEDYLTMPVLIRRGQTRGYTDSS